VEDTKFSWAADTAAERGLLPPPSRDTARTARAAREEGEDGPLRYSDRSRMLQEDTAAQRRIFGDRVQHAVANIREVKEACAGGAAGDHIEEVYEQGVVLGDRTTPFSPRNGADRHLGQAWLAQEADDECSRLFRGADKNNDQTLTHRDFTRFITTSPHDTHYLSHGDYAWEELWEAYDETQTEKGFLTKKEFQKVYKERFMNLIASRKLAEADATRQHLEDELRKHEDATAVRSVSPEVEEEVEDGICVAIFAMGDFKKAEALLGGIEGVLDSHVGHIKGVEVVHVVYNSGVCSYSRHLLAAFESYEERSQKHATGSALELSLMAKERYAMCCYPLTLTQKAAVERLLGLGASRLGPMYRAKAMEAKAALHDAVLSRQTSRAEGLSTEAEIEIAAIKLEAEIKELKLAARKAESEAKRHGESSVGPLVTPSPDGEQKAYLKRSLEGQEILYQLELVHQDIRRRLLCKANHAVAFSKKFEIPKGIGTRHEVQGGWREHQESTAPTHVDADQKGSRTFLKTMEKIRNTALDHARKNNRKFSLKRIFKDMDLDDNGTVDEYEFKTALEQMGVSLEQREFNAVWRFFDRDGGGVQYQEFVWDFYNRRALVAGSARAEKLGHSLTHQTRAERLEEDARVPEGTRHEYADVAIKLKICFDQDLKAERSARESEEIDLNPELQEAHNKYWDAKRVRFLKQISKDVSEALALRDSAVTPGLVTNPKLSEDSKGLSIIELRIMQSKKKTSWPVEALSRHLCKIAKDVSSPFYNPGKTTAHTNPEWDVIVALGPELDPAGGSTSARRGSYGTGDPNAMSLNVPVMDLDNSRPQHALNARDMPNVFDPNALKMFRTSDALKRSAEKIIRKEVELQACRAEGEKKLISLGLHAGVPEHWEAALVGYNERQALTPDKTPYYHIWTYNPRLSFPAGPLRQTTRSGTSQDEPTSPTTSRPRRTPKVSPEASRYDRAAYGLHGWRREQGQRGLIPGVPPRLGYGRHPPHALPPPLPTPLRHDGPR